MSKYRWRGVVLEERNNMVTHYGLARALKAIDLNAAQAEVERVNYRHGVNCIQILDEDERVVSYKMLGQGLSLGGWR